MKKKCEVWWGLSNSSTNLAKELLPSEYVTLSPPKETSCVEVRQYFGQLPTSAVSQRLESATIIDSVDTENFITREEEINPIALNTVGSTLISDNNN